MIPEDQKNCFGGTVDKIKAYGWPPLDDPGVPMWIDKNDLEKDMDYQRDTSDYKTREIASNFKWKAFVAIGVSKRGGICYVYDGWHRVMAARKRSDIKNVLCIVFAHASSKDEAQSFLDTNTMRRNVSSIATFKTKIHAEHKDAEYVQRILSENGIRLALGSTAPRTTSTVAGLFKMVKESPEHFERAVSMSSELCMNAPINSNLITGLFYLSKTLETPFSDTRLRKRILSVGNEELNRAAMSMAAAHNHFTPKYYAEGMLSSINRTLRKQFLVKKE